MTIFLFNHPDYKFNSGNASFMDNTCIKSLHVYKIKNNCCKITNELDVLFTISWTRREAYFTVTNGSFFNI